MAIRAILYDNDGTLVDTHDLILSSMRHTTRLMLGRTLPDEQLMAGVGTPLASQMVEFADGDEALANEMLRVYRTHNHAHHDAEVRTFPDVLDGLRTLREAGLAQGVVTAKMHPLAQRGLEIVGAWRYLDCLVGADDCPKSKPDPDPIVLGAEMLGLSPRECVYVGDSPYDIQAGNAAGCTTVAALWGMFPEQALVAEQPDFTCASFPAFVACAIELAEGGSRRKGGTEK